MGGRGSRGRTGIPGCGTHLCNRKGGFCGGGGYVLSRGAMKHIMSPDVEVQKKEKKKKEKFTNPKGEILRGWMEKNPNQGKKNRAVSFPLKTVPNILTYLIHLTLFFALWI